MSTPKGPDVRSTAAQGSYTEGWRFLTEDLTLEIQQYGKLVQLFGKGLMTWDAWMLLGRHTDVSTRNLQVIMEGSFLDTVDVSVQVSSGAANADLTFVGAKNTLRVGFVVHIPAKYTGGTVSTSYRCASKTYSATSGPGATPAWTYVCKPLQTGQQITVAIPVGQKLIVGASMYAAGTQQPAGMTTEYYDAWLTTRIMKESVFFEGGQGALKEWNVLSQSAEGANLKARAEMQAQLRMRLQLNDAFLMGRKINVSGGITQNNRSGEANQILSADGLIPTMVSDAMKLPYTGSFNEDYFDMIPFLLASQGVSAKTASLYKGPELGLNIENSMMKLVKEYSGGSDLYDKLKGVGFGVSEIYKNGFKTYLVDVPEFANPVLYGATGYNFESMGMLFSDSKVTAPVTMNAINPNGAAAGAGQVKSVYNFEMGYLNFNGENRRLITGNKAGVNGYGIPFSDDWDDSAIYTLCEIMPIFTAMNQTILITSADA